MSTATLIVVVGQRDSTDPTKIHATIPGNDPINVVLEIPKTNSGTEIERYLDSLDLNARVLLSGRIRLSDDGNTPLIVPFSACHATEDQYANEVSLFGRFTATARDSGTGKSACRTLAVNDFKKKDTGDFEELTSYFPVRGFANRRERLLNAPKGSAAYVHGCLQQLSNREGHPYCEIRCRLLNLSEKARDTSHGKAVGYEQSAFSGASEMPSFN